MVTITTGLGPIEGIENDGVQQFLGIRFAEAPIGERRFLPPVPTGPWTGTYDATRHGNKAVQSPQPAILGPPGPGDPDEDCLFLNVVTPAADGARRPVLFWIHGGAYILGSGNDYDGATLARQGDVVVVTVNYRLGLFGFLDLSSEGPEFAGSASNGFRDQICGLQWVHDHIADFGGDPDNITIFGESAGGGSVMALLASPSADGLYAKAIAHSPGGVNVAPTDLLTPLAAMVPGDGPLVDRLRALTAEDLLDAQVKLANLGGGAIDGVVVTRHPVDAIADRGQAGVPLIAGSNHDEGTLFSAMYRQFPEVFEIMSRGLASEVMRGVGVEGYLQRLADTYADDDKLAWGERIWVDLFRRAALEAAETATTAGPGGWLYRFDLPSTAFGGGLGATHAAEIGFTFNWYASDDPQGILFHDAHDPAVKRLAEQWSNTVLAFARTGDPNGAGLPTWPRYDPVERKCLILDAEPRVEADPDDPHRKLWTEG